MTVVLNEAAIAALLETQEGPVGRFVQRVGEQVLAQAQSNVRAYFVSAPTLDVDRDVGLSMDGSSAVIGIQDGGEKAQRLARAQRDGRVNWLLNAVEAARGA